MVASFVFFGFINLVSCTNENGRKLYESSNPNIINNHSNIGYENSQVSHQNWRGPSLLDSTLSHNSQFIKLDHFLFPCQNATSNQSTFMPVYFNHMIPNLAIFEKTLPKPQEPLLQDPIGNLYSMTSNQQVATNRLSFSPTILEQNPSKPYQSSSLIDDQNALTSNPSQPPPIIPGQIQKFQNALISSNLQLDRAEEALTGFTNLNHKVGMNLGDRMMKPNQSPTGRKRQYVHWKARELNSLLEGVNEHGRDWKTILKSYKFRKGRTSIDLRRKFDDLERNNKIVQTKEGRWKFIIQGELADSVRAEGENEQMQSQKGSQEHAELDQEGSLFVKANKKKRRVPWKREEFIHLVEGVNTYGNDWGKIREMYKFEQGRTPGHLVVRFSILKKYGQVTFIKGFGWKFVNEKDSIHSNENEPSKAIENQERPPFFVERAKKSCMRDYLPWKKDDLDNLLDGVNKHGRNWKKILDSYAFEGRTSKQLAAQFANMEKMGQIVQKKGFGWKYTASFEKKLRNKIIL